MSAANALSGLISVLSGGSQLAQDPLASLTSLTTEVCANLTKNIRKVFLPPAVEKAITAQPMGSITIHGRAPRQ